MNETSIQKMTAGVWEKLYSEGKNDLHYPNDVLVRLGAHYFDPTQHRRILDFGFGAGANLVHFAKRGFEMYGAEVSEHAVKLTREKLLANNLIAGLRLTSPGEPLSYQTGWFDAVYAWQVICYNDKEGWLATVKELERVTKPGGLIVVATCAPGDSFFIQSDWIGKATFRSTLPGQEGCIITIPEKYELPDYFPGRNIEVGDFGFQYGDRVGRYWIVMYKNE